MTDANPFEGLTIERAEALPKRIVAGRESIPNPFVDAVHDSYREAKDQGQDKAVRAITVPVDRSKVTVRTVVRTDKNGNESATQWEQHPNITTALYLLRQAAQKHDIGVRIVVDYKQEQVPTVTHKYKVTDKDGNVVKENGKDKVATATYTNVTKNRLDIKQGRVRIRFLGQDKKKSEKSKGTPEADAA